MPLLSRRSAATQLAALALSTAVLPLQAQAQTPTTLRISSPALPEDWHGKMWTVFKEQLDKTALGEFDVRINLNGTLFKQGTEPTAMARGNLELATVAAFDITKLLPAFSLLTAGYILRDPQHLRKVLGDPTGDDLYKSVADKLDITILSPLYVLLAVPLFVLAANLMNAGTVSERIFDFYRILVGRCRARLADGGCSHHCSTQKHAA